MPEIRYEILLMPRMLTMIYNNYCKLPVIYLTGWQWKSTTNNNIIHYYFGMQASGLLPTYGRLVSYILKQ